MFRKAKYKRKKIQGNQENHISSKLDLTKNSLWFSAYSLENTFVVEIVPKFRANRIELGHLIKNIPDINEPVKYWNENFVFSNLRKWQDTIEEVWKHKVMLFLWIELNFFVCLLWRQLSFYFTKKIFVQLYFWHFCHEKEMIWMLEPTKHNKWHSNPGDRQTVWPLWWRRVAKSWFFRI